MRIILLAPLILVLHVVEEAPGFVAWFNSLVRPGISQSSFLRVNLTALVITGLVTALLAITKDQGAAIATIGWLSFLMFANGLLHLTATVVRQSYSPGTLTAATLYLPYFSWFLWLTIRQFKLRPVTVALTVILGSAPMLVHGYLIVFKGSRLF